MSKHAAADLTRRPYHSQRRRQQADQTRQRILGAARRLMVSAGYAGTTVEAIATAADVSPKTVAAVFGSKREIIAALVDPSAFGRQFQEVHERLEATAGPERRLALAAQLARRAYETLAAEFELLRGAQAVAPEIAALAAEVGARRRHNQAPLIAELSDRSLLRRDLTPEAAADVLWTLTGYDLYRALVIESGWPADRYETWLVDILMERLLEPHTELPALPGQVVK